MLMDNKGGSSAAISGGSGENTSFLNAPESLMGGVDNFEAAFNAEQVPRAEVTELPVADIAEAAPSAERAEMAEAAVESKEMASPAEQDIQEFRDLTSHYTKPNEDDIDSHVASKFNSDMKKYEDDPYQKSKAFFGDGWAYKKAAFHRGVGDGLNGTGETAA